jgi:murein DD-endopeptidase MepM/ murein hydrolase activator NlpD
MNSMCCTYIASIAGALPRITSKFLEVEKTVHPLPHTGVDFAVDMHTKLMSIGDGIVESVVDYGTKNVGKGVFVKLDNGVRLLYGHLDNITVKPGQHLSAGDIIGLSGNTGHSTGPHLHLQAYDVGGKLIDPTSMAEGVFNSVASSGVSGDWGGGILDKLNPFKGVETQIQNLNTKLDNFAYWANPVNLIKEGWKFLENFFNSGNADIFLLAGTIAAIWLIMLGAEKPKKYLFWAWIIFWLLRAVIFAC